jgi:hypothetical protein
MDPEDFRYRVADDGRIAIAGLTLQETLELEALLWWQDVATDMSRELRLLELYLKHHTASASSRRVIDTGSPAPRNVRPARDIGSGDTRRTRRMAGVAQPVQVLRSAVAIGMVSMGMFTIYLIVVSL